MGESSVKLPVQVEDAKALAELKKIQSALGAVGKESVELNKKIATAMEGMANKAGKSLDDISRKAIDFRKTWTEVNSILEVGKKILGGLNQGVELAHFSAEFRRLHNAIPVERLNKLRDETRGTVSEFELLKRAAKEMNLSATEGFDEQGLALRRALAEWENFFDRAKAAIGSFIGDTIVWVNKLASLLSQYVNGEAAPETVSDAAQQRARAAADAKYRALAGNRLQPGAGTTYGDARKSFEWQSLYDAELAGQNAGIQASSAVGRQLPAAGLNQARAVIAAQRPARRRRGGGGGPADTSWTFGDLLRPSGPDYGGYLADSVRTGAGAIERWSSDGWAFSAGEASGGGDIWGAGMAAGGRLNASAAADQRMSEFTSKLQDRTQLLGGAFGALSDGLAASVEAAITGSESIGKAWMRASAMALKAIATEQAVRALVAGASAIGAIAMGSPGAAAAFGKEAALHAAAAAAAGIGAAALGAGAGGGGGGGPSASSQPGGGNYASSGGGSSSGSQTVNVYVTGAISAGDHQKLGAEINKAIRAGRAGGRVRDEQTITTRFE